MTFAAMAFKNKKAMGSFLLGLPMALVG